MDVTTSLTCRAPTPGGRVCDTPLHKKVSTTAKNPGREFFQFPHHGFVEWKDKIHVPTAPMEEDGSTAVLAAVTASSGYTAQRQSSSSGAGPTPMSFHQWTMKNKAPEGPQRQPGGASLERLQGTVMNLSVKMDEMAAAINETKIQQEKILHMLSSKNE